jgi:carbamate kinase
VERVALNFGQPDQRWIDQLDVDEASVLLARGEFAVGSMGPKMDALVRFARSARGRTALLTTMDRLGDALAGRAGTRIVNT